ncbi:MAG: mechanosensitive ion channel domain-containing protein [Paracoccaceae bacterium]
MTATLKMATRQLAVWLMLLAVAVFAIATPAPAQDASQNAASEEVEDTEFRAPVIVDGEVLFEVRGSSALPATERAAEVAERIISIAESSEETSVSIEVRNNVFGREILIDGQSVSITTRADAENDQMEIDVLAFLHAEAIQEAIIAYRVARSDQARVKSAIAAVAWSVGFLVLSIFFLARRQAVVQAIQRLAERYFLHVEEATKSILRRRAFATLVGYAVLVVMWTIYLILFYYYLSFVLLSFAETRPVAELLLTYVSGPLITVLQGILAYLPNVVMLVIIYLLTRWTVRGMTLFFENLENGVFEIPDFEKHWIGPTVFLLRIVIILIALVFAYPYLPGSDSRAFQGLTILAGVMVSLGSNTVVSNIMAGLFVIYRRSTNVGDRIEIGGKVGDVVEIKLMETVIKSVKNEMISIPNSQLLNSEVVNFTRKVDGRGLLVHTTVGIGYEEPPAKVVAMLIEAANRTPGLKARPEPFVLWTQLADYAINYEINAFTSRGASLPKIKSDLHQNIVEVFNENRTQIMTPSYMADPEVPKIPDQAWDGTLAHESGSVPDEA